MPVSGVNAIPVRTFGKPQDDSAPSHDSGEPPLMMPPPVPPPPPSQGSDPCDSPLGGRHSFGEASRPEQGRSLPSEDKRDAADGSSIWSGAATPGAWIPPSGPPPAVGPPPLPGMPPAAIPPGGPGAPPPQAPGPLPRAPGPGESWRDLIEMMYRRFNPEKLAEMDRILEKYRGNEADLYAALLEKYDQRAAPPGAQPGPALPSQPPPWGWPPPPHHMWQQPPPWQPPPVGLMPPWQPPQGPPPQAWLPPSRPPFGAPPGSWGAPLPPPRAPVPDSALALPFAPIDGVMAAHAQPAAVPGSRSRSRSR